MVTSHSDVFAFCQLSNWRPVVASEPAAKAEGWPPSDRKACPGQGDLGAQYLLRQLTAEFPGGIVVDHCDNGLSDSLGLATLEWSSNSVHKNQGDPSPLQ